MTTSKQKNRKSAILQARKVAYIIIATIALLILFSLTSCKPKEVIVSRTEYVNKVHYDSIYLIKHDSIHIRERGDTVTIEKFKTVFKDRLKIQKDTILRTDTFTTVPVKIIKTEKVQVYGFFWWTGLLSIIAALAFIIFKFSNFQIFK